MIRYDRPLNRPFLSRFRLFPALNLIFSDTRTGRTDVGCMNTRLVHSN